MVFRNLGTQYFLHDTLAKHIGKRGKLRGRNGVYRGSIRNIILKPAGIISIGSSGRNYGDNCCLCCFIDQRQYSAFLSSLKYFEERCKGENTAKERCNAQKFTTSCTQFLQALPHCQHNAVRQFCTDGPRRLPSISMQHELLVEREHTHQLFQEKGVAFSPVQQHLCQALGKRAWEKRVQVKGSGRRTQWSKGQQQEQSHAHHLSKRSGSGNAGIRRYYGIVRVHTLAQHLRWTCRTSQGNAATV